MPKNESEKNGEKLDPIEKHRDFGLSYNKNLENIPNMKSFGHSQQQNIKDKYFFKGNQYLVGTLYYSLRKIKDIDNGKKVEYEEPKKNGDTKKSNKRLANSKQKKIGMII